MKILSNEPLANYTSLKAGGPAERLIITEEGDSLSDIVEDFKKQGSIKVLGFGTNCLVSDHGLPGTVILNKTGSIKRLSSTIFRVDSGVNWDHLVQQVIDGKLWGAEFSSGIPGGVGAAIAGNIAAYGHKVSDMLVEATILNEDGSMEIWKKEDFKFSYRSSALHKPENKNLVIIDGVFEFSESPTGELEYQKALAAAKDMGINPDSLENRRRIILEARWRAGSLLGDLSEGPWTAGSFFKNPSVGENQINEILKSEETNLSEDQIIRQNRLHTNNNSRVPAALVMLAAGFERGQAWGQVRLHPDHVLKIENMGGASAQEIYDVVQNIIVTVKEKLDIVLEPEVKFIGKF